MGSGTNRKARLSRGTRIHRRQGSKVLTALGGKRLKPHERTNWLKRRADRTADIAAATKPEE